MSREVICYQIEVLRSELGKKYEKSMYSGFVDDEVIKMSYRLDVLIVEYIRKTRNMDKNA